MEASNNLKQKFGHAVKWSAIGNLSSQIIRWLVTFWVIRILSPDDYGIIALAGVLEGLLVILTQQGLITPLIQKQNISGKQYQEFMGTVIIVHVLFFIGQFFAADFIAALYNEAVISDIVKLTSFAFLILIFNALPTAKMTRKLQFKQLSIIAFIANTSSALLTLVLAFNDFGLWSIVYGQLYTITVSTLLKVFYCRQFYRPTFGIKQTKALFSFGILMSASSILGHIMLSVDVLIGGLKLTAAELGIYAVAMQISLIPLKKIGPVIKQVVFPLIAGIQENKSQVQRIATKLQKFSMLMIFPIFWGISATAELFIPVLIGEKWISAVLPIQLLTFMIPLRFSAEIYSACVRGLGYGKFMLVNATISLVVIVPAVSIGMFYGATGLACAWLIGFSLIYVILLSRYKKILSLTLVDITSTLLLPVVLSTVMYVFIAIIKYLLVGLPGVLLLVITISLSIILYFGLLWLFDKSAIQEILAMRKNK